MFKVNHINLGLVYEAYFVCNTQTEAYFKNVANELEKEYAIKTGIYVYDKEPFTKNIKTHLKYSRNVLFILTSGVTESAAKDETLPFRQVYSYVHNNNQNSISLVAVNGCTVDYSINYPEDMKSFNWLHRKNFFINSQSEQQTAKIFCDELRRNHSYTEVKKLERIATEGDTIADDMYSALCKISGFSAIYYLLMFILEIFTSSDFNKFISLIVVLSYVVTSFVLIPLYIIKSACYRDVLCDVSNVFSNFRYYTRKRLAIIIGFIIGILSYCFMSYLEISVKSQYAGGLKHIFFLNLLIFSVLFVYNTILYVSFGKIALYVRFASFRHKIRLIFIPVFIALAVFVVIYINSVFDMDWTSFVSHTIKQIC